MDSFDKHINNSYNCYAEKNSNSELTIVYAEKNRRPGTHKEFKKMIQDCIDGKIDKVITKSISRFARNAQDSKHYIMKLKELGIGVWFEKEYIDTSHSSTELLLTVLNVLIEEDNRIISTDFKCVK